MTDNRTWHRWIAMPLVLFFVVIAVTGVALQADMWLEGKSPPGSEKKEPPAKGYSADAARNAIAQALATATAGRPDVMLSSVAIDRRGGVVTVGIAGKEGGQIRIDAATGAVLAPLPSMEKGWHYVLQDIHAGYFAGTAGRIVSTLAGLGMLVLSVTGLMVYLNLFRRRFRMGRKNPFWR